ncbi:hypothetical protein ABEB36_006116 [Hypothenemus hampei]|uniref:Uncharacterized protein n=1 Tax=Hypothenemus hampei TaxID=57062 RepID=A0ABD1F0L4_HYPHA
MFSKLVVVVCLALAVCANEEAFKTFKVKFQKNYSNEDEHQVRYEIFNNNLQTIQEHNAKYNQGLVSWYMAVNQFTDMTPEEFRTTILAAQPANLSQWGTTEQHVAAVEAPASIDWRTQNLVTGVKNQGSCGSCWTFSAVGTLEGAYAKAHGELLSFSEQELVDCCTDASGYNGAGCNGGVIQSAIDYVRDHGIVLESSYAYEAVQKSCRQSGSVFTVKGYTEIKANNEDDLKNAVGNVGPVAVAVNANGFQNYGGGVYDDSGCSHSINHGVLAVGYADDYWIVKNSWGASWGESGYIKMKMGYNICAIASQACYPNV